MVLNKKDTSIVTLTLLLSIATSPVAWATSRWNSNSSVTSSALSESSLWSRGQVRNIDIKSESEDWSVQNPGDFKLKSGSNSAVRLIAKSPIALSQIDPRLSPANTNNDSLVGQSSQMQPTTVPATEGEIPIWLWWLLPVIPFLGLWVNLQFKAQRSKSPVKKQEDPISVPSSTKPDVTGEQPQKNSNQIDFNSLTEPLKTPFSPTINKQFIEPLKTPFSPTITTFSLPRTIIKKDNHTETFELEENLQPQGASISLMESEADNLDSAIAIPHQESILLEDEDQVKTQSEAEFLISSESPEPGFYPVENGEIEEVSEVVLIKEIDPNEAEAVIAEFLTTKISVSEIVEPEPDIQNESIIVELDSTELESTVAPVSDGLTEPEISVSEIVESEPEFQHESVIVESDSTELEPTVAPIDNELAEPEISVSEIVEPEPEFQHESIIVESDSTELEPTVAPIDNELAEPEISVSEIVEPEPEFQHESIIVESDSTELESTVAPVTHELTEPEISVSEIVESEPDFQHESVIVESDSTELESTVAPVTHELTEPEISVSEVLKPETEVIELGVPHQEIRSETDVAATKFNVGKEIKFEPSLADVDQGLAPLPEGYGQSQIFLLPRDPNWAYAYWDIPNEHKEHIRHQGGKHLLLRVYDVTAIDLDTQPPLSVQEYECDEMAREWHIPIAMSDRDYIAELGYLTLDGRWLVLVRSNHIHIPPIYPTDWENYQFINIPWDEDLRGKTFFKL
ncbi:DUF4912 domain-containing protein [Planktothrix paucivesiculata]|uniref:DUF4912 domain-containing protein n=1 Tax=Planktothrix paucivesiculata PCC 9631 TaxID=671071 RepID=A0A7Z9BJ93_9CYAN|nr:DUF4912 domain-containing protein [Planktothrix paucivesiculata]VXD13201.1 conserved exported hypothetical protein [Planktothrix paucivesiculata PCC 9631]